VTGQSHDEPMTVTVNAKGLDGDNSGTTGAKVLPDERVFGCKWKSRKVDVGSTSSNCIVGRCNERTGLAEKQCN